MSKINLPNTDSIDELAQFWDRHDLTEYEDQLEKVAERVFQREKVVQVPLNPQQAATAEQIAASQGITLPALIQQWVNEHVADR